MQHPSGDQLSVESVLVSYQKKMDQEIADSIALLGSKNPLRDACEYALTTGGKRFRPALVYIVSEGLGNGLNVSFAALAVEYLHSASLIADDLPCMDNESERRNKPTVHKAFGETTALLASYALIAAAFELIAKNGEVLRKSSPNRCLDPSEICRLAVLLTSQKTGILGTTGGQYLDIFPPNYEIETIEEIIYKKTVTLFDLSLCLGWLFGGGDVTHLSTVSSAADHFGTAFQIVDDLEDMVQDQMHRSSINFAVCVGVEKAVYRAQKHLEHFIQDLKDLGLSHTLLSVFAESLLKKIAHFS